VRQARSLTAHRSTDLALGVELGNGKVATGLRRHVLPTGSWCSILGRKERQMGGDTGRTEDTVDDRGFSSGGFLIDEPSNQPLQRTVAFGARR